MSPNDCASILKPVVCASAVCVLQLEARMIAAKQQSRASLNGERAVVIFFWCALVTGELYLVVLDTYTPEF